MSSLSFGQWSVCSATVIGYFVGDDVRELGQRHRAGDHVLDPEAGAELGTTGRELDDAVAAGVGEALQGGVDASPMTVQLIAGNAIRVLLGAVQHLGVDLGRCDGHGTSSRWFGCPRRSISRSGRAGSAAAQTARRYLGDAMTSTTLMLMPDFLDPIKLIGYFGTWALVGLLVVIFVESGVLFPVLPGDTLLFVAGMLAAGTAARRTGQLPAVAAAGLHPDRRDPRRAGRAISSAGTWAPTCSSRTRASSNSATWTRLTPSSSSADRSRS